MEPTAEKVSAIERARDYGIDISLLESYLTLTPTERLIGNQNMLALAEALTQAREQKRARRPSSSGASVGS
jgi:hypothetical protein